MTVSTGTASKGFDAAALRADFPTLKDEEIYLDSVASSLTPRTVVEAMNEFYFTFRANVHRGVYDASLEASEHYEQAQAAIAAFIGAGPEELVLTLNTTAAINLIALSLDFSPGDEIVLSTLEHTSNMIPWSRLAARHGLRLRWYHPGVQGVFDVEEFAPLINERTRLVTLTHVSNVLGTVVPVHDVARLCRAAGVPFLVDAAQAVPHMPVDVRAIGCDFLAFSGHKMLGPTGIGGLYIRREWAERLTPAVLGGGSIDTTGRCGCPSLEECTIDYAVFSDLPHKWQAGTPPIAEALGLAEAARYLTALGPAAVAAHDRELMALALDGLSRIPGVRVYGPGKAEQMSSILSFNVGDHSPHDVGQLLDSHHRIGVRSGQHCALSYFKDAPEIEQPGSVRASFYLYNTAEEVHRFVAAVEDVSRRLL
ncbi:cysteine desulfurase [Streptomyces sp. NPDC049577]|uniref:aminotransferase class V-fold PLP-dependent enzyme n=1 Tax=Streptomyces sp. NPDC049577 TaxID=3155153 RepID=UPI003441D7D5